MPVVKTYSPSDICIYLAGGGYRVTGLVSVSIAFPTERFKIVRGIKGQNVRVRNQDTSCSISIEVLQTSTANDVFNDILSQDIVTGLGRLDLILEDISGNSKVSSNNCFISNYPETRFSNELETRTWVIHMLDTDIIQISGNSQNRPQFIEDIASFLGKSASQIAGAAQSAVQTVTDLF